MANHEARDIAPKEQQMIHLNVGDARFHMLRETIERYRLSKLAKLIREFPTQGTISNPLYVDWNPKTFNWIIEIYRFEQTFALVEKPVRCLGSATMSLALQRCHGRPCRMN